MHSFKIYNNNIKPDANEKQEIVNFLFNHLGEYGDPKEHILNCLEFATMESLNAQGGFALAIYEKEELLGVTIINKTGMAGFIPENILVYIAVHEKTRGKGIGKALMEKAIDLAEGDIALHVEPDNPAKRLYEKLGFTNKYLEMRLRR
ncbi:MAG: GNAT family N-acetyltransferase [Flavobacteriaceae bacterium]|nr:GNAT family N-acetyltransferase [Flavobacteriaceae bacterium]